MSRALSIAGSLCMLGLVACAHATTRQACPAATSADTAQVPAHDASSLPWVEPSSIASAHEPLAVYDVRWLVLTGESGAYASVPPTLHTFTLGRWECALGAEIGLDDYREGMATTHRERRLVCTHPTGVVAQSQLACEWHSPSPVRAGSPTQAKRELHLTLSDAPSVSLSCEPVAIERLPIYDRDRVSSREVCVIAGRVETCPPVTR